MDLLYWLVFLFFLFLITTLGLVVWLHKRTNTILIKLNILDKHAAQHQEWMFGALYSMNHNVKLPEDKDRTVFKPAIITSDANDPMGEFDGRHDDYVR